MSAFYLEQTRDEILVTGIDARKFLHSQLANDIASLTIGNSRYSLLLEPTGKITSLVRVRCIAEDNFILDTESEIILCSTRRTSCCIGKISVGITL